MASVQALSYADFEILVIDNTDGDPPSQDAARAAGARYVVAPQPGLSRARNVGAREALGDIVAFIDDDAVANRLWLANHSAILHDSSLSASTGRTLLMHERTEAAKAYAAMGADDLGTRPLRFSDATPDWFEIANFGGIGTGSNMVFRRSLFRDGWAFRETIGAGTTLPASEEHYIFFKLVQASHSIAYVPEALVYHEPPKTMKDLHFRNTRNLRGGSGLLAMLLVEEPKFRRQAFTYGFTALRGRRRWWRRTAAASFASRRQIIAAGAVGPYLYLRSRMLG